MRQTWALVRPQPAWQHAHGRLLAASRSQCVRRRVLLALFSLTQVFLALPAGRYADRHGLKRPMGLGVMAASLGASMAVLWPHFWVLCLGALLMGGATGAASIALQRHVGRAATDSTELKRVFSWLAIGPAVSNFIGPVAAGLLIDHVGIWMGGSAGDDNGFRGAFVMLALLPWATWLWVRHTVELPPVAQPPGATHQQYGTCCASRACAACCW
jgi:MFS family permease